MSEQSQQLDMAEVALWLHYRRYLWYERRQCRVLERAHPHPAAHHWLHNNPLLIHFFSTLPLFAFADGYSIIPQSLITTVTTAAALLMLTLAISSVVVLAKGNTLYKKTWDLVSTVLTFRDSKHRNTAREKPRYGNIVSFVTSTDLCSDVHHSYQAFCFMGFKDKALPEPKWSCEAFANHDTEKPGLRICVTFFVMRILSGYLDLHWSSARYTLLRSGTDWIGILIPILAASLKYFITERCWLHVSYRSEKISGQIQLAIIVS